MNGISNDDTGRLIREGMIVLFQGLDDVNNKKEMRLYTLKESEHIVYKDSSGNSYDVLNELILN